MHELRKNKLVICGLKVLELTAELQPPNLRLSFSHTQRKTDPILILSIRFTKPLGEKREGGTVEG